MKRLFTAVIVVGFLLGVRSAHADDAAVQVSGAFSNNPGKVNLQVRGDGDAHAARDILMLANGGAFAPRTIEFTPDGRGNMIFTASAPVKTEKGAFLGIYATRAPAVLKEQMKLKAGLVVDRVKPKSPADLAGLRPLDVVEKLDDQWLINPDQLLGLLRMHKPGEMISLSIFHKGDRQMLKVKLDEHDVPVADDESPIDLWGSSMTDGSAAKMWVDRLTDGPAPMLKAIKILNGKGTSDSAEGDAAYEDKGVSLRLTFKDGHRSLTATDKSGKTIFKGPIDSAQDREKLPKEVQQKMEKLEQLKSDVEANERLGEAQRALQQDAK